jgi:CBS domain-containing protein
MAMNSDWCKSLTNWQKTVTTWISVPNPQEILKISIFFDFRPVYGDFNLANQLQKYCQKVLKEQHVFFYNLAQTAINIKVSNADSLRDSDKFDVKIPLLTITSIARLWSLRYGIGERNTTERFQALKNIGVFSSVQHDEFVQAFRFFMLLRLKNQLMQMKQKEPVGNSLDPKLLSEIEKITVKKALSVISDHQNRLGIEFRG